jgi:hypothetical protein
MSVLVYEGWRLDWPEVVYTYRWDGGVLRQTMGLGELPRERLERAPADVVANLLAHAGLAFTRYFFALADFDQVQVEPLDLPAPARRYFEHSLRAGLAEMRYRNGLDPRKPVRLSCSPGAPRYPPAELLDGPPHALLFNGGGKDSAVAGELLREIGLPFTWLTVQSPATAAMRGVAAASGNPRALHVEHRGRRPELAGAARYHDVVAPRLGFVSLLPAWLLGARYVISANEHSANYGNLTVGGVTINHQYGKSLAAERGFAAYVESYLVRGLRCFSLLAPLYELQIAALFARHPGYFPCFLSCNVGQRENRWCGACPKCAFVFLALAAFLDAGALRAIFGADLFAAPRIRHWLRRLTVERKPFECVGTRREAKLALHLALARQPRPPEVSEADWTALGELCAGFDPRAAAAEVLGRWDRPHRIPAELAPAVMACLARRLEGMGGPRTAPGTA